GGTTHGPPVRIALRGPPHRSGDVHSNLQKHTRRTVRNGPLTRRYGMLRTMSMALKLTPTSYVVLGMVAMRGATTSYDLKRAIGHSVGYFWPFPHAQLYSEPKRLVELGLLSVSSEQDG